MDLSLTTFKVVVILIGPRFVDFRVILTGPRFVDFRVILTGPRFVDFRVILTGPRFVDFRVILTGPRFVDFRVILIGPRFVDFRVEKMRGEINVLWPVNKRVCVFLWGFLFSFLFGGGGGWGGLGGFGGGGWGGCCGQILILESGNLSWKRLAGQMVLYNNSRCGHQEFHPGRGAKVIL